MLNEAMITKRTMLKTLGALAGVMLVGPLLPSVSLADHSGESNVGACFERVAPGCPDRRRT